jgi:putative PIN family toxin of toxin-antitoxin system
VIRATLDANVLASAFPGERGVPSILLERWTNLEFELILSEHILASLASAWLKPYFRRLFGENQVLEALDLLRTRSTIVVPVLTVHGVAEDEEDDLVLATVIAGAAEYLVTGDKRLQALGEFQKVVIVSPRQFLDILELHDHYAS